MTWQPPSDKDSTGAGSEPTSGTGGTPPEPTQPPWSTPAVPGIPPSTPPEASQPYPGPPEPYPGPPQPYPGPPEPTYQSTPEQPYQSPPEAYPPPPPPAYQPEPPTTAYQPDQYQQQYQQPYQQPYQQNPPYPPAAGYPTGYPEAKRTNGLAIAALICSLAGLLILISAPVGAVLGHMAKRQIKQTGEDGDGLATAAIIVGWVLTGLFVIGCCIGAILIFAAAGSTTIN